MPKHHQASWMAFAAIIREISFCQSRQPLQLAWMRVAARDSIISISFTRTFLKAWL